MIVGMQNKTYYQRLKEQGLSWLSWKLKEFMET